MILLYWVYNENEFIKTLLRVDNLLIFDEYFESLARVMSRSLMVRGLGLLSGVMDEPVTVKLSSDRSAWPLNLSHEKEKWINGIITVLFRSASLHIWFVHTHSHCDGPNFAPLLRFLSFSELVEVLVEGVSEQPDNFMVRVWFWRENGKNRALVEELRQNSHIHTAPNPFLLANLLASQNTYSWWAISQSLPADDWYSDSADRKHIDF